MDIKQIRRANMLALIEREPSKAAFARKVGTDPAYISQILSTKTKAEVGNDLARGIEAAYKLPHGWMDHEHASPDIEASQAPLPAFSKDQLMIATVWPYLPPEKKDEMLEQMARDPDRYKALMDALLTEVAHSTVRAGGGANLSWSGQERRQRNKENEDD
jgi:hypothetical protein